MRRLQKLNLDRDVHACGQVEFLQFVHCLCGRLDDVEQALVGADFELIHRFLVHVGRTVDREFLDACREGNRARDLCAGALGGLHDISGGLVEPPLVECLEPDAYALSCGHINRWLKIISLSGPALPPGLARAPARSARVPWNMRSGLWTASGSPWSNRTFRRAGPRGSRC